MIIVIVCCVINCYKDAVNFYEKFGKWLKQIACYITKVSYSRQLKTQLDQISNDNIKSLNFNET